MLKKILSRESSLDERNAVWNTYIENQIWSPEEKISYLLPCDRNPLAIHVRRRMHGRHEGCQGGEPLTGQARATVGLPYRCVGGAVCSTCGGRLGATTNTGELGWFPSLVGKASSDIGTSFFTIRLILALFSILEQFFWRHGQVVRQGTANPLPQF